MLKRHRGLLSNIIVTNQHQCISNSTSATGGSVLTTTSYVSGILNDQKNHIITYYKGEVYHRLDGPAISHKKISDQFKDQYYEDCKLIIKPQKFSDNSSVIWKIKKYKVSIERYFGNYWYQIIYDSGMYNIVHESELDIPQRPKYFV